MAAAKRGLGKGLGALIPTETADSIDVVPGTGYAELPIDAISPNPKQPRTVFAEEEMAELAHSIAEIGLLQPIVVRPTASGYELIAGERRLRASKQAGLDNIPAIIRETSDDDLLRDALLENLHRAQLNPLEEAAAYAQLLDDFGCTQEELAGRIGRSRPQVSNTIRLLKLPPSVQRRVAAGVLSAGHARALLALDDEDAMERMANRVVAEGLSVRNVEELVLLGDDEESGKKKRRRRQTNADPELVDVANELESRAADALDTRVTVAAPRNTKARGKIVIEYAGVEDLRRIIDRICE